MNLSKKDQQFLLKLSRNALEHIFKTGQEKRVDISTVPDSLKVDAATFVTLTKNSELRGCIGKLKAQKRLFEDVIENTYSAAFRDPRFPQLTKEELPDIEIEISVLCEPKQLEFKDKKDLIKKLKNKPGVILSYGLYQSTFLPQVWEELPDPNNFLTHLCRKAGLPEDFLEHDKPDILTYTVNKFSETS